MIPKMSKDMPQKMVIPQARVPMMQDLRQGGGTMKVFGDGKVPKMMGLHDGGHMKMKK